MGNNQDAGIYAPVVASQTITRGPQTYTTTNTYHSQAYAATGPNFNDYGRPYQVAESGDAGSRTTTLVYKYGFTPYIRDRVESETVTVGSEAFSSSYAYSTATGFKTNETIRGITTTFTPTSDGRGNVWKVTDAHNHERVFTYSYGRANRAQTPTYNPLWTRVINADGTVQSETRREFTTGFGYDALMRPTSVTPPVGNATTTVYDLVEGGRYSRTTRGNSRVEVFVDGFGRPSSSRNSLGVATDTSYDACGQKTYESVPYCLSGSAVCTVATSNTGVQSRFDGLGRLVRRVNTADSSVATYTYSSGIDVTIQDEESRTTTQNWSAFGDPDDAWLTGVTDGRNKTWTYSYNALGSLKNVAPPEGGARTWTYFPTTGLLKSETHPESGTVNYTYDGAGRLSTRTDPQFGATTYLYDSDDRSTGLDRSGTEYDISQTWDASNNRETLNTANVSSTFTFDGANRLRSRTDIVGGRSFSTVYTPDANDNIDILQYPSGNSVDYDYDNENRVSKVLNGARTTTYADSFTYHPSGGILSFKPGGAGNAGNGTQSFTYDSRYRLATIGTGLRSLTYGYNRVGNVTSVTDARSGKSRTSIGYDEIDRLTSVTGFGAGAYTYDALGNRLTSTVGGSVTYTYNAGTGRLTSHTGSGTFGYDNNGNQTSDGVQAFGYTPDNMLKSVGGIQYDYDGDLLRTRRTGASGAKRYYIHGPGNEILSEFEEACASAGTAQLVRDYVYAGGRMIAAVKPATAAVQVRFATASSSPSEAASVASVGVQVITSNGAATTCPVTVRYGTSDGTGLAGVDYAATSGSLTFDANSANGAVKSISVPLVNDNACKGNRTFSVQISDPEGAVLTPSATTHTVTKVEDDLVCVVGSKWVSGDHTPDGGSVVYTITLTNTGSSAQRDLVGNEFTDTVSTDLTLVSASASAGSASTSGNTATWNGSIPAGGSVTLTLNAKTKLGTAARSLSNYGTFAYDLHYQGTNTTSGQTNQVTSQVGIGRTNFFTVTPCRVLDTRDATGPYGGPALPAGAPREFTIHGACGIPSTAKAISLNVTVVGPTAPGQVTLYPAGIPPTGTTTINYSAGQVRANNSVMVLNAGKLAAVCWQQAGTSVHIIVDVNGYFQ